MKKHNLRWFARVSLLAAIAAENGVQVCPIYGDTFDDRVTNYIDLMKFDADSLAKCLG